MGTEGIGQGVATADLIAVSDALRFFPRPGGRKASLPTVYRWIKYGVRRVKLKAVRAGGTIATTEQWVREFLAAINPDQPAVSEIRPSEMETRRQRAVDAELDALGF